MAMVRTARDHYADHLGPVYTWMVGDIGAALSRGAAELDALPLPSKVGGTAVDLGAGFGLHAIPLARRGFSVVAMDTCDSLLQELEANKGLLPIRTVNADLPAFRESQSRLPFCGNISRLRLHTLAGRRPFHFGPRRCGANTDLFSGICRHQRDRARPIASARRRILAPSREQLLQAAPFAPVGDRTPEFPGTLGAARHRPGRNDPRDRPEAGITYRLNGNAR